MRVKGQYMGKEDEMKLQVVDKETHRKIHSGYGSKSNATIKWSRGSTFSFSICVLFVFIYTSTIKIAVASGL
jgi:hypothetical protein